MNAIALPVSFLGLAALCTHAPTLRPQSFAEPAAAVGRGARVDLHLHTTPDRRSLDLVCQWRNLVMLSADALPVNLSLDSTSFSRSTGATCFGYTPDRIFFCTRPFHVPDSGGSFSIDCSIDLGPKSYTMGRPGNEPPNWRVDIASAKMLRIVHLVAVIDAETGVPISGWAFPQYQAWTELDAFLSLQDSVNADLDRARGRNVFMRVMVILDTSGHVEAAPAERFAVSPSTPGAMPEASDRSSDSMPMLR